MYHHKSVLKQEAINCLEIDKDGVYIDATYGRGGHSKEILKKLTSGFLFSFDHDKEAIKNSKKIKNTNFFAIHKNFIEIESFCKQKKLINKVSGVLFDLGISSPMVDDAKRGFSFKKDGALDMRMNTNKNKTAFKWLNYSDEKIIFFALKEYGQDRFAKRITNGIIKERAHKPIQTTLQLVDVIKKSIPFEDKHKHFATRTFQAIRIAVNDEVENLKKGLEVAYRVLKKGGKLVVISFHSVEDGIVKRFIKGQNNFVANNPSYRFLPQNNKQKFKNIKRIKPQQDEILSNPRARSAILRAATVI
jgi:16S rRNA (cytosine1402-N4)-methyltransferase